MFLYINVQIWNYSTLKNTKQVSLNLYSLPHTLWMYSQEINHSLQGCRSKEGPCDISGLYAIIITTEKK